MQITALTGTRVRARRVLAGLRQADLARAAGISASYLNLIEHNRRRVGGDVLARLAAALDVAPETLAEGAGGALMDGLRDAAAGERSDLERAELERIEEFAGRFPGWAELIVAQHRRLAQMERAVEALSDRMTHDPFLSASLHEVLSALSSVRSTAAILAETEDIDPAWRVRFHQNLHSDSERLAEGAEALVAYLDGSDQAEERGIAAPQEELEAWLEARGWHLAGLEQGEDAPDALIAQAPELASNAARRLAKDWITRYVADATALPLKAFQAALAEVGTDPGRLAQMFGADIMAVFRRLATLPKARAGLVVCDASGALVFRKPVDGFALPRFGAACPLWPLYAALARPMTPIQARIEMAGRNPQRFRTFALCQPRFPAGFGGPQISEAAMLVLPEDLADAALAQGATGEVVQVGTSCRICPREACVARREPSIMSEGR